MTGLLAGIDTGGTFTDFVFFDGEKLRIGKLLSSPDAPERSIMQGLQEYCAVYPECVVHGSTVATNAVLEGKGVKTLYVTNHGLGEMLTIGRQAREHLYDLLPPVVSPPVPHDLCIEVGGRLASNGDVVTPLSAEDCQRVYAAIQQHQPAAVAINLLFPFIDARFEKELETIIPGDVFVSRSSAVLDEMNEYERGIATWLNAWVGPLVQRYIQSLEHQLSQTTIHIMQSNAGIVPASTAGQDAVRMLLSGPAGGLMGAKFVAAASSIDKLLTFDMGGTSTDVALIDGDIQLTTEGRISHYPVAVQMVDMHTIGAGGGSIAYLDEGGLLQVGPQSAGASPGPACYAKGGTNATVTDANLILGRIPATASLGGYMQLDRDLSVRVCEEALAKPLGCSVEEAALGVIKVANDHMARALRVMSIQRGLDPKEFTLLSFGGAGGLHVCELAEIMQMTRAMVPVYAGVLSALGMLVAPLTWQQSRTVRQLLNDEDMLEMCGVMDKLRDELISNANNSGYAETLESVLTADLRYQGQTHTLNVAWSVRAGNMREAFEALHELRYGHRMDLSVEVVTLRANVQYQPFAWQLPDWPAEIDGQENKPGMTRLYGEHDDVPVYEREKLIAGQCINGPAIIVESVATTYLKSGWSCSVDRVGNLLLEMQV